MTKADLGPVSAVLEADLRTWVRRHGIVLWLDLDNHYTAFVDRLIELRGDGSLPYDVRGFRGSYLELMLAPEPLEGGVEKTPLVIHLPGFNEEAVRSTPLLELYSAGARYRKALETLVTDAARGHVRPEQIAAFRNRGGFTLEDADAWLAELLSEGSGGLDRAAPGDEPRGRPRRPAGRRARRRAARNDGGPGSPLGAACRGNRPARGMARGGAARRRPARGGCRRLRPRAGARRRVRRRPQTVRPSASDSSRSGGSQGPWWTPAAASPHTSASDIRTSTAGRPMRPRRRSPTRSRPPGPRTLGRSIPSGSRRTKCSAARTCRARRRGLGLGPRLGGCSRRGNLLLAPRRPVPSLGVAPRRRCGPAREGDRVRGRDARREGGHRGGGRAVRQPRRRGGSSRTATWNSGAGAPLPPAPGVRVASHPARSRALALARLGRSAGPATSMRSARPGASSPPPHSSSGRSSTRSSAHSRRRRVRRPSSSSTPSATRWVRSSTGRSPTRPRRPCCSAPVSRSSPPRPRSG